jgi:hypothetical protein
LGFAATSTITASVTAAATDDAIVTASANALTAYQLWTFMTVHFLMSFIGDW